MRAPHWSFRRATWPARAWRSAYRVTLQGAALTPCHTTARMSRRGELLPHFENFPFLHGAEIFNLFGLGVCELFELFHRPLSFVLAHLLFLLELFDRFLDVAADVAHGGAMIFEDLVQMLDH